jgi:hypothetical protein
MKVEFSPDVPIRVIPILLHDFEDIITVITCRSKSVELEVELVKKRTHSLSGAMIGTVSVSESTMEIIVLIIASVLSTLV